MVKKSLLILLIALAIFGLWSLRKPNVQPLNQKTPQNSALVANTTDNPPQNILDYQIDDRNFRAAWFYTDATHLTLIPNYFEKNTSYDIVEKRGCKNLINAGFYDKDGHPLGLVIANGKVINDYRANKLFNGIISIKNGSARITAQQPDNSETAVQTGPILIKQNQPSQLAINNDKAARRSIAAITSENKLLFFILFNPNSTYEGPLLGDLPNHLQKIEQLLDISLSDAINLDGGSASAFKTADFSLGELTNVGSFFCTK